MFDTTTDRAAIRWADETARAANALGWHVVETVGVSDYQGWGVHLLRGIRDAADYMVLLDAELADSSADVVSLLSARALDDRWAVLAWFYGSCSGCDSYEDEWYKWPRTPAEDAELAVKLWGELVEECPSEDVARAKFDERKNW